ncbi:hypothetical protein HDF19_00405 [Mucilaginibacter sp. E4BP6]|uniref:hypothetical protein n=1 Tax=Mucilaginibacter sp. E4BP6 TaxID=2723089 RepID=UPI0015CCE857|nr:hypothetical protein [Mucilaginibacter sp. E4BP6]NYE66963.1 hypothetical protein [Mucilaginibacter sp. E4BP6]
MNIAFFIHNWDWTKKDGLRMSILDGFSWVFLLISWILIKIFAKRKTWEWIFNSMFFNGSKKLKELPKLIKRYRLVFFSIIIFFLTWSCASLYAAVSPPDLRILGKEKLVIVKKYGDLVICRYLDSANNRLNNNIKIIKLEGNTCLVTKVIPSPSY